MKVKTLFPWWSKILIKLILSRIPVSYRLWQRLDIFKHGAMEQPAYVYNTFNRHFERLNADNRIKDFTLLELGPGDSLATAILASIHGSAAVYLIDSGFYARRDIAPYIHMKSFLEEQGLIAPELSGSQSLQVLLDKCNAQYGVEGLNSLRNIPTGSVDFIFSNAVLEHIRKFEFIATMKELRRIVKPNGACSHTVDLKDHLGGALNNLRFSESCWESELMANSGFYTNRIRYSEMLKIFSDVGFSADIVDVNKWNKLPIRRRFLADEFRHYSDGELLISAFEVVLRPQ